MRSHSMAVYWGPHTSAQLLCPETQQRSSYQGQVHQRIPHSGCHQECKQRRKPERSFFHATTLFWGHLVSKQILPSLTTTAPFPITNNLSAQNDKQVCMCVIVGVGFQLYPIAGGLPFTSSSKRLSVTACPKKLLDKSSNTWSRLEALSVYK